MIIMKIIKFQSSFDCFCSYLQAVCKLIMHICKLPYIIVNKNNIGPKSLFEMLLEPSKGKREHACHRSVLGEEVFHQCC